MRKTYVKPEIMFEDFTVNTHIAAGCELILPAAEGVCAYPIRGGSVFVDESTGCMETTAPNGEYGSGNNMICYHNPNTSNNLFNS